MQTLPKSAVHGAVPLLGLAAFAAGVLVVRALAPWGEVALAGLLLVGVVGAALVGAEFLGPRSDNGLDAARHAPSLERTAVKLLGFLGTLAFLALGYLLFPVYSDPLYGPFFAMLPWLVPAWLVAAVPYFYLVDRRMREPHDGYWQMGQLLRLRWREVDRAIFAQHVLGWLVKGFFLPLMFGYLGLGLEKILDYGAGLPGESRSWYVLASNGMYFVDVTLAAVGYLATLRIAGSHIRSAEPTLLGWAVALACYQPFWGMLSERYLAYRGAHDWQDWAAGLPALYIGWGGVILLLTAVYLWATLAFGCRFSNLTHRGILTNGPYRFSKHPAYLAKNLSWWLVAVPFLAEGGAWDGALRCLMLLGVNALYWLRARTEERHLSRDPVYVQYALWMEEHGLLRPVTRLPGFGFLRYRVPAT
ncbi:MAG TPA: isoprenylcysteine carboxyl methyltransferase [Gammaproteobacteria bacterium]